MVNNVGGILGAERMEMLVNITDSLSAGTIDLKGTASSIGAVVGKIFKAKSVYTMKDVYATLSSCSSKAPGKAIGAVAGNPNGGVAVLPDEWLTDKVAYQYSSLDFKDYYDILLIADDIQVGCCRSGNFFSFERAGIIPDMVTLSKSIGGCGMPVALVLFKPELDIWEPGQHTGTFRGNQLSLIAGKAGLEYFVDNGLDKEVQRKAKVVEEFLTEEILPMDKRISYRGIGLIWGLDFSGFDRDVTKPLIAACFRNGLIVERVGRDNNVLKLMPPLVIEDDLLMKGLLILKKSLQEVL